MFCIVQVSRKQSCNSSFRSNCVGLLVLPSPHDLFLRCVDLCWVIFELLKLSGDIEGNLGPNQDKWGAIVNTVTEIKTSQHQLQLGLQSVQAMLTEIEINLASLQLCNEKVIKREEPVSTINKDIVRWSSEVESWKA